METEMRSHIEMQTEENLAAGMTPKDARQAALRQFGRLESLKETCRDQRGVSGFETLVGDIRFAIRMLRKNPGFTTISVLTLALGIGANTAIFSIISGVLLRPLPYRDPDRLVMVCESNPRFSAQILVTPANLRAWSEQNSIFAELGGEIYASFNLTGNEKPEHLNAACTTPNFFSIFGVAPFLGRTYGADDRSSGDRRVAILSYGFWQRRFAGDRGVIGRSIALNQVNYTVMGVMPEHFKIFPAPLFGLPTGEVDPQLWVPYEGSMNENGAHFFASFARLRSGVTLSQAQGEMNRIVAQLNQEFPRGPGWGATVQPLREEIIGSSRTACLLLLGAVGFVLLIACANVANLSLARAAGRVREFAIRAALGAARWRIVRQLLVESVVLAMLGGGLGVLLAHWSLAGLLAFLPARSPRFDEVGLDGSVLWFTLLVSLLTGLLFGLAPAMDASKLDLQGWLKDAARGSSEGRHRQRARGFLVVAEVAAAMILLAGAGLMINSFARLICVNPGFEPEQLISFDGSPPEIAYAEDEKRIRLVKQLRARVEALPGVKSAAIVYGLPFGTMLNATCGALIEDRSRSDRQESVNVAWRVVSPGYFETMGAPVLLGRAFSEELDRQNSLPVVMINETFARKYFSHKSPVGRRIQVFTVSTNWNQIVGVVKDLKLTGLDAPTAPEIYQPDSQQAPWMFSLVVRSSLPLWQVEKMVRTQAAAIDKDLPLFNIRTMEQAISASVASPRFLMILIGLFAGLAITLTAVGIYGMVSYSVGQRTREIGIRLALGAPRGSVLRLFLCQGLALAIVGIVIGLAGSFALTRLLAAQLFEIGPTDPLTFGVVVSFVMQVTLLACFLAARQATTVDPMVSLR
jgi:putative ABC transport system permease protein